MSKDKNPPFVMVTNQALDSPAWRAMSLGARLLYIALKRRYWPNRKNNGKISLSHRHARKEIGSGATQIVRWYRELAYYGFIVMMTPGHLGGEQGKGSKMAIDRGRLYAWHLQQRHGGHADIGFS
jgi:hypothetical protein